MPVIKRRQRKTMQQQIASSLLWRTFSAILCLFSKLIYKFTIY